MFATGEVGVLMCDRRDVRLKQDFSFVLGEWMASGSLKLGHLDS